MFVPRWKQGVPAALDLAVTSGLQHDNVLTSARDPSQCLVQYEDFKSSYLTRAANAWTKAWRSSLS